MRIKKDKLNVYSIEIILLVILFFALFVPNIFNRKILACILFIFAIFTYKKIGKKVIESIYKKQVIIIMISAGIIYLSGFYIIGIYFGFYKATIKFSIWAIINYIIPIGVLIISSEVLRNVFVEQKDKLSEILIFIALVIVDLLVYKNIYDIDSVEMLLEVVGYVLFASISCNLLYNYVGKRFGNLPIIFYRLITVLYVYIIPIIPDVYVFFRTFLRMIYPYFIYLLLEFLYAKSNISATAIYGRKKNIIIGGILFLLMTGVIMLVSCQFKYGIIVIGSGSMTGTIDKGDSIIFEKYDNTKLKTGQVIIFEKDGERIVHRIIEIKNVNGEKRYITKGDMNQKADENYITNDKIIGIYKFRIKKIGYPSLWLRDIFE